MTPTVIRKLLIGKPHFIARVRLLIQLGADKLFPKVLWLLVWTPLVQEYQQVLNLPDFGLSPVQDDFVPALELFPVEIEAVEQRPCLLRIAGGITVCPAYRALGTDAGVVDLAADAAKRWLISRYAEATGGHIPTGPHYALLARLAACGGRK